MQLWEVFAKNKQKKEQHKFKFLYLQFKKDLLQPKVSIPLRFRVMGGMGGHTDNTALDTTTYRVNRLRGRFSENSMVFVSALVCLSVHNLFASLSFHPR